MKVRLIATLAAVLAAAGCASSVSGRGSVNGSRSGSAGPASRSGDFPASTAPASTAAGTSTVPSTGAPSTASASTHPVPSAPLRTVTVHAGDGRTYVVKLWAQVTDPTCFDHAHGNPVVTFLTKHPCSGLRRVLGTTTVKGRPVGFALSETGFPGTPADPYKWASEFITLENKDGTGSIDDLLMDGYRLPSGPTAIPAGEAFNVMGQDSGVAIWDIWYLDGPTPTNAKPLMTMAEELYLQF